MRFLTTVLAIAAATLCATSAMAQMQAAAYAEANRPKIAPRALTPDEKRTLSDALRATPDAATLIRLQPIANAGDKAAMRAMINGYRQVTAIPGVDKPADAAFMLAAQWGAAFIQLHDLDRDAAAAIQPCFLRNGQIRYDKDAKRRDAKWFQGKRHSDNVDCGFMVLVTPKRFLDPSESLYSYAKGKGDPWTAATFTMTPIQSVEMVEAGRFQEHLNRKNAYLYDVESPRWVSDYVARTPGAKARLDTALAGGERYRAEREARMNAPPPPVAGSADIDKSLADLRASFPRGVPDNMLVSIELSAQRFGAPALNYFAKKAKLQLENSKTQLCFGGFKDYCGGPTQQAGSSSSSSGSGFRGIDPNASTQALKDYNNRVNQQNCARASLGASITCGR